MDNPPPVSCPQCSHVVGEISVVSEGQEWLCVNGIAVRAMHGVCIRCGAEFHWSVGDRMLAELVQSVLKMRQTSLPNA